MFSVKESAVTVDGSPMTYVTFGRGQRPLVLIPGLSLRGVHGSGPGLAWMYRRFLRDYRVYVFDKKERLPEPCTMAALAEDLSKAMETLNLRDADVMGVSQGGIIAQYLALEHPALVRRLVLAVTVSRPDDTLRAAVGDWVRMSEAGDTAAIVRDMTERMYSAAWVKKYGWLFPLLLKTTKLEEPARFVTLAKACLTADTYDRLGELRCPVLVLGGAEDRIASADASRAMAERLGCECRIYPGLGHAAYEEAPDFNERVYRFFQG